MASNNLADITSSIKTSLETKLGKSDKATSASVADQVAWSNVSDKPPSFPPSGHRHNWGDIDGAPSSQVVEFWNSGNNWLRVWSNGWKEQGGLASRTGRNSTINLNIPFSNTNYTPNAVGIKPSYESNTPTCDTFTTTSFHAYHGDSMNGILWFACGY